MSSKLYSFTQFHPGSKIARQLFSQKEKIIKEIIINPRNGLNILSNDFSFGKKTDFWDDHVFNLIISPALQIICSKDLNIAINQYSLLDHLLFNLYIRRDEDPVRFRRAFWNLNHFGIELARRFKLESSSLENKVLNPKNNFIYKKRDYNIAFVFKGPFELAHAEFFEAFLRGTRIFKNKCNVHLILIDSHKPEKFNHESLGHVYVHSLKTYGKDVYTKLAAYYQLFEIYQFDHLSWIACVQNLSLYMGQRIAESQSYWSMKYHSIIMDSIDKYAGLGFGGDSFFFDDTNWFRGRAFPEINLPSCNETKIASIKRQFGISATSIVLGCFVRTEKLNNPQYWELIEKILTNHTDIHFCLAAQSMPEVAKSYLQKPAFQARFHNLGWVNTKVMCQCLDLYLDSFPRGSCLTALEAIKARVPVALFDTAHNRESSALPYLMSTCPNQKVPGVFMVDMVESLYRSLLPLITNTKIRASLAKSQGILLKELEGKGYLFAKDYLNYFLDSRFSLNNSL